MAQRLEHDEMIEILEDIARNGSPTAQIQAIKTLREMGSSELDEESPFQALYPDEIAERRNRKAA